MGLEYGPGPGSELSMLAMIGGIVEPPDGQKKHPRKVLREWREKAWKLIEDWDIRRAAKLIELFPLCVPNWARGKRIYADYDERGDWALFVD